MNIAWNGSPKARASDNRAKSFHCGKRSIHPIAISPSTKTCPPPMRGEYVGTIRERSAFIAMGFTIFLLEPISELRRRSLALQNQTPECYRGQTLLLGLKSVYTAQRRIRRTNRQLARDCRSLQHLQRSSVMPCWISDFDAFKVSDYFGWITMFDFFVDYFLVAT